MSNFVHLHNHSHYSIRDGVSKIGDMVSKAKELGFESIALTDHGTCAGLYSFYKTCKKKEIKPILGMETYIVPNHLEKVKGQKPWHLVLLAKNKAGYKNLVKLSSIAYTDGFYGKPRIDFDLLSKHHEGLIVSSACRNGEVSRALLEEDGGFEKAIGVVNKHKELFGDDYYLEIMFHVYNSKEDTKEEMLLAKKMKELAEKTNTKAICTNDCHYVNKDDAKSHDILLAIADIDTIKNPERRTYNSNQFYLKSYEEMKKLYSSAPELLENTIEIQNKIEEDLIEVSDELLLPDFEIPQGFDSEEAYLKELVTIGMKERGLFGKDKYRKRVKYEMDVILGCKYTKYFLILWDIINFCNQNNLRVGIGRGSAVSSLVLYALGITKLDPLKYDLLFERFLNPERISPPDVDLDFDYDRRSEVYEYIVRTYHPDHCAQIGTYGKYKARSIIRATAKVLDICDDWEKNKYYKVKGIDKEAKESLFLSDAISKTIPPVPNITLTEAYKSKKNWEFRNYMDKYPELYKQALRLEGTISSSGTHAAGIVVCKDPITDHVPLKIYKGTISTQFDKDELEELGLLKMDILALKTLSVIEKTLKKIRSKNKDMITFEPDDLEPDDPEVLDTFNDLKNMGTMGLFQFESDGISQLLNNMHVSDFNDLIAANALYRPGPMGANLHNLYCDYKHKRKPIKYLHPKMGESLAKTYGIMCFDKNQIVYTDSGPMKIQNIVNQKVYCKDNNEIKAKKTFANGSIPCGSFINGNKDVYKYTLSNGTNILCTNNHEIYTNDGYKEIKEIYSKNIPIPYSIGTISNKENVCSKELKKAYLIGALLGDGSLKNSTPRLCVGKNKKYGEQIANLYRDIYGADATTKIFYSTRSWYVDFSFSSNRHKFGVNKCNTLFEEIKKMNINVSSPSKCIPFNDILQTRKHYLSLVAGLIDTDGCIGSSIYFSSTSDNLLNGFEYIMWRLGYHTYRCAHASHVYESKNLFEEIKSYLILKNGCCHKVKFNGKNLTLDSNMVKKYLNYYMSNFSSQRSFCKYYGINRSTLRRILSGKQSLCKKQSVERVLSDLEINSCLSLKILSKEFVGKNEVYDISMPHKEHNFIINSGIIVHNCYQEDIMKISQTMAGFTGGQADTLRKVMGKKKPELIKKEKLDELFINGCIEYNIDPKIAKEVFSQMANFAGYGFNKSHSAAYSFLAYQTSWFKTYYPLEFMCSLLTSELGNDDKLRLYCKASQKMNIKLWKHDINRSGLEFRIEEVCIDDENERVLRLPLTSLKNVGEKAVRNIVENQPYSSIYDFVNKTEGRLVNIKVFSTLVNSGCMNSWKMPKSKLLEIYPEAKKAISKQKKEEGKYKDNLFEDFSGKIKV